MTSLFGELCAVCAVLGCLYLLLSICVVWLWRPPGKPNGQASAEPVTILKPLCGDEPDLVRCLSSFCMQNYPAPIQVIFGVQDANDGALHAAREIQARFPDLAVVIKIDGTAHGANAKVSNLMNMQSAATHDILIAADSDILVGPDHVERVAALLQRAGVGAVSVLYCGAAAAGIWSKLSAQCINAHFLPNVLVGMALHLAKPCFGSTIALRRQTLENLGGLRTFVNQLADDYAIGEAVRRTGQSIEIGSIPAIHLCCEESAYGLLCHQLRWARTIKTIDLAGYAGAFITYPFAIASLGTAAGDDSCLAIAAIALCLRLVLCKTVERSFQLERQNLWLVPVTAWMVFSVYVWSFLGSAVTWKRSHYNVLSDGSLAPSQHG